MPSATLVEPTRPAAPATGATPACLLMTATLNPPASAVARHDPQLRLRDYQEALDFNLQLPDEAIDRIVFVDNSDADLGPLVALARQRLHGKRVEFIGFQGNDHPPERGKAYGEFRLIDHGLASSRLIGPDTLVWKTTGRLKFLNLAAMHAALAGRAFDYACDLHNVPYVGSRRWNSRCHMDLRVFAFRQSAFEQDLRGIWQRCTPGFDMVDMYAAMMAARRRGARLIPRFPLQPQLQGISGRHQRDYQSARHVGADRVRASLRRVAPWLWL